MKGTLQKTRDGIFSEYDGTENSGLQKRHSAEIANEINRLHNLVYTNQKQTIGYAIECGALLSDAKTMFKNNFENWVFTNIGISARTAQRYIDIFNYQKQIASAENLSTAYKMIETLEAQKKQAETAKAYQRVAEYKKTGVKPENWRRGTDDKIAKEEEDRDARVEAVKREAAEKKIYQAEKEKAGAQRIREAEDLMFSLSEHAKELDKRINFKEKIRLSAEGMKDPFQDAIIDYLSVLDDDNRRIEACYNIIKICKRIAVELQGKNT